MLEDYDLFITQFVTLYALLEPIGHLSLFLALTGEHSKADRLRLAILSPLFAFAVLSFFALAGQTLLNAMNVSILSFQIAGGIILFSFSLSMIFGEAKKPSGVPEEKNLISQAIYPLATPTIAGPGAILSVVLLADNNRGSPIAQSMTVLAVASMMMLLMGAFLAGDIITRLIGSGGTNLVRRVMGILIAALSVDLVLSALAKWLHLPPI